MIEQLMYAWHTTSLQILYIWHTMPVNNNIENYLQLITRGIHSLKTGCGRQLSRDIVLDTIKS